MTPPNLPAASNPAAPGAPSAGPVPPPPAGPAEVSAVLYAHDASTLAPCDADWRPSVQIDCDVDMRLVDALLGHAIARIGNRWRARLTGQHDAGELDLEGFGNDEYDAICDLARQLEDLWGSRRRKPLVLTPVPPAFRGRCADNDVEAAE